jgi:hypothetical protein
MLKEDDFFSNVIYSINIDYFEGYDIIIVKEKRKFGVSIYVETKRGKNYKKVKTDRHSYLELKEIRFPVKLNECKKIGNIFVLTEKHKNELKNIVKKEIENEKNI